jgi:hypothetical protein
MQRCVGKNAFNLGKWVPCWVTCTGSLHAHTERNSKSYVLFIYVDRSWIEEVVGERLGGNLGRAIVTGNSR